MLGDGDVEAGLRVRRALDVFEGALLLLTGTDRVPWVAPWNSIQLTGAKHGRHSTQWRGAVDRWVAQMSAHYPAFTPLMEQYMMATVHLGGDDAQWYDSLMKLVNRCKKSCSSGRNVTTYASAEDIANASAAAAAKAEAAQAEPAAGSSMAVDKGALGTVGEEAMPCGNDGD